MLILGLFIILTFFAGIVLSAMRRYVAEYVGDFPLDDTLWYWIQLVIGFT